jgi:hypothetical protein
MHRHDSYLMRKRRHVNFKYEDTSNASLANRR